MRRLIGWVAAREPVAAATGLAAVITAALAVAAAFGAHLTPEQIAAIGTLVTALAGWAARSVVTPVHRPKSNRGSVPVALIVLVAAFVVFLAAMGACLDAAFNDDDELDDLGRNRPTLGLSGKVGPRIG